MDADEDDEDESLLPLLESLEGGLEVGDLKREIKRTASVTSPWSPFDNEGDEDEAFDVSFEGEEGVQTIAAILTLRN